MRSVDERGRRLRRCGRAAESARRGCGSPHRAGPPDGRGPDRGPAVARRPLARIVANADPAGPSTVRRGCTPPFVAVIVRGTAVAVCGIGGALAAADPTEASR